QMDHPVRRPQAGFIPQRLRSAFESTLDLADLLRTQPRLAPGTPSLPKPSQTFGVQLGRPPAYRLPMRADPARYFRLAQSLPQQPRRAHPPPLQRLVVPAYPCWKSHAINLSTKYQQCHYITRVSISGHKVTILNPADRSVIASGTTDNSGIIEFDVPDGTYTLLGASDEPQSVQVQA